VAVVDAERQANELRQDRRAARPGLDRAALATRLLRDVFCLLQQIAVDETGLSRRNEPWAYLFFFA
jgi:hypothetical protein